MAQGGLSAWNGQTVRGSVVDHPKIASEPPVAHPKNGPFVPYSWTVRDEGTIHALLTDRPPNSLQPRQPTQRIERKTRKNLR
jgi:hypothetical protein